MTNIYKLRETILMNFAFIIKIIK